MATHTELRVFVSSTFRDLQEEREHLVKTIFPKIRALCRARGITFTEVDLRWGLTDENVVLGQVIGTCLAEIDRCRPYFIGITGERYGYVPALLEYYKDPELLRTYPWIEEAAIEGASIIDLEFRHAVLNHGALDDALRSDVVPRDVAVGSDAVIVAVANDGAVSDGVVNDDIVKDGPVNDGAVNDAVVNVGAVNHGVVYDGTVNNVVINDGNVNDSAVNNIAVNAGAVNDRVVDLPRASRDTSRFFFRSRRPESDVDDTERERLESLKQRVRDRGFVTEEFRDPASLGEAVFDALMEIIDRDFAEAAAPSALDQERLSHSAFAESRRHAYIPNPEYLKRLNEWFGQRDQTLVTPLTIYAESGSGKSSLVSFWCQQMRRKYPTLPVVEHYVGIGAGASDHLAIMRHIMDEIRELFDRTENLPSKPEELERQFANWLGFSVGKPLLIVIDGVNQLTGRALELTWIPLVMPPGVKVIVTTTVEQTLVDLRERGWSTLGIQPLSEQEREAVIVRFLAEYRKALSTEQVHRVSADIKCSHPLFLRTLLEELRIEARHETIDRELDRYLAATGTEDLFQLVLERMEESYSTHALRSVMSLIWCSRAGLDEHDLQSLTDVSRLKISTMIGGLDYHLVRKGGVLTFFHDYLRRAVEKRYLPQDRTREVHWQQLASHFEHAPLTLRSTRELLNALEMLREHERLREVIAAIPRFELLWPGEGQYEVLRNWVGIPPEQIGSRMVNALNVWRSCEQPPDRLSTVLKHVCSLLSTVGCWSDAESITREWIRIASVNRDLSAHSRALSFLSRILHDTGSASEAAQTADEAESIARELGDPTCVALAVGNRGVIYHGRNEYEKALECFAEQEVIAREIGDQSSVASAVGNRGNICSLRGEYDEALTFFAEQESIARGLGDRRVISYAVGSRGNVHLGRDELDEALECYSASASIARELGDRRGVALRVSDSGIVHSRRGDYGQSLACYYEAESIARDLGDQHSAALALGNCGILHLDRHEHDKSLACLADAVQIHTALGDRKCCSYWFAAASNLLLENPASAVGDFPWPAATSNLDSLAEVDTNSLALLRARALALESHRISGDLRLPSISFESELLLARIDYREGRHDQARTALQTLLAASPDASEAVECHYWFWKFKLEPDFDHRAAAERLYSELYSRNRKFVYQQKLAELCTVPEASPGESPVGPPSATPTASSKALSTESHTAPPASPPGISE